MACNSDYMNASTKERELSRVACLIDELAGKPRHKSYWDGYHPDIYNKEVDADKLVARLCQQLQTVDVKQYSLEMQMWWRDHQAIDRARLELEMAQKKDDADRKAALLKLTRHEQDLLGVSGKLLGCPNDTNGDGNCGRPACPYCGISVKW